MRVNVCVATKNRTDMLHQLLWSLIRQERREWDLVIVDDSDVPVKWESLGVYPRLFREIIRTGHDIRVAPGPGVSRIGAAYQAGFQTAKQDNPLFLRVDDDSWLEPDYLSRLVAVMERDDVAACGGLFLHPGSDIETLPADDDRLKHARIAHLSDTVNIQWFRHAQADLIPVEHLTANILFSSRWLERVGGFESILYNQHRDETQVTWRLHVEGGRLFVNPAAVAWHLRGVNGGARGHRAEVYLEDHRRFMAQRRTMKPGIHVNLGHAIGDGLMATPMLARMRELNPDRNIAVFAPWAEAVLKNNPNIDEIAKHYMDAQRTIRLEQSVYAWAGANRWNGHLAEAYCAMFDLPAPEDHIPILRLDESDVPEDLPEGDFVVIAPWSTARTFDYYGPSGNKNWPEDRWAQVTAYLQGLGLTVLQLRGSDEEPLIHGVDIDFCGRPLRAAFAAIGRAELLISVDTMAHHAAAALNTPSVVLWGRSLPRRFGYETTWIVNLQGECPGLPKSGTARETAEGADRDPSVWERPCVGGDQWAMDQRPCPIDGHPCMTGIETDRVIDAAEYLLERRPQRRAAG